MGKSFWLFVVCVVLAVVFTLGSARVQWQRNRADLGVLKGILADKVFLARPILSLSGLDQVDCRAGWLLGLAYDRLGMVAARDRAWQTALACSSNYLSFFLALKIDNQKLAEESTLLYPESPYSWFWYADTLTDKASLDDWTKPSNPLDLDRLVLAYRKGLSLDPGNGLRWRRLGDILHVSDPQAAIQAYLQSCYHGDPGVNGCYRAGLTAEKLGDLENAVAYYRLSKWSGSLEQADRLEQQLQEQKAP
jgi:hypothetical protein